MTCGARFCDTPDEIVVMPNHVHEIIVIRNDWELDAIHNYIESNPRNWAEDEENISLGK